MVELTLVRHGQANSGAADERNYDRLSPLGFEQAQWLGEHLRANDQRFDVILSGSMRRHRETAGAIAAAVGAEIVEDPRLNEMDYFGLAAALQTRARLPFPTDRETFITHFQEVMQFWSEGEIDSHLESFSTFEGRIRAMLDLAEARGGRVMMVTSGGVISMAMRLLLGLEPRRMAHLILQIHNSSLHRYVKAADTLVLDSFNAIPHLERPDRAHARTYL